MDKKVRDEIEYIEYMQQKVIEVAIAAYKDLGDIELVWGKSEVVNDDIDEYSDDHDVFVLQGKRPGGGDAVFTWVRANAHTTVYPMENNGLSADWVGPFRKKLMESGSGLVVFHNGPIGSVYPKDPEVCEEEDAFPDGWKDPDLKPEDFAKVTCVGYEYADAALAAVAQGKPLAAEAGIKFRHVTYGFHPTNFALMQLGVIGPLPIPNIDTKDPTQLMDSYFSWITIGELELLTTPGESFPTFALHAKEVLAQATEGTAIVLGLTQDWMGYLIPVKMWEDPALDYHRTISPGETVEPAYLEALQQLVDMEKE